VVFSLSTTTFLAGQVVQVQALQLDAEIFADGICTGEDSNVFAHGFAASPNQGLTAHTFNVPRSLFTTRVAGFAFDVFSDDQERLADLGHLFETGSRSFSC